MQQIDCINQQARERGLTKRSQAERLAIADSLIASVWEEYLNGSIDRGTLQVAAYIQANANRIVWKLNELNNPNTPNTSKALDALSIVQKDEEDREPMDGVGYEEYRLVLSHDLVIGDTRIKLNDPIVTNYIVLRGYRFPNPNMVPMLINEMMEKMKDYLLGRIGGAW